MKSIRALALAVGLGVLLVPPAARSSVAEVPALTAKVNAAIECINRLSERSHLSRHRYFSWVSKNGPTGKERIIYGTYTIYDTSDCRKKVEKANALAPHEPRAEHGGLDASKEEQGAHTRGDAHVREREAGRVDEQRQGRAP